MRPTVSLSSLFVAVLLSSWATAVAAPPAPATGSAVANGGTPAHEGDVMRRISELQRDGRRAEALELLAGELAARPGDPLLLYNRACLENRLGRGDEAVGSLRAAIDAGFDDFGHAAGDPDLASGPAASRLAAVVADARARRGAMSARRGARLAQDVPTSLALEPAPGLPGPDGSRVTVTWRTHGLSLRVETGPDGAACLPGGDASPWSGGAGLLVALGPLGADDTGETADTFVFGFGLEKNSAAGAVYVPAARGWQRVRELEPKIRGAGSARVTIDVTIPWNALAPYHPLVDPVLGLNVALTRPGGGDGPRLMPERILERPGLPRHLAARLDCDLSTAAPGQFVGRTPTSIVEGGQAALNLVATGRAAGTATLALAFQDAEGHPLLAGEAAPEAVELSAGVTRLNRAVDFSRLRPGPCRVNAELSFPDGTRAAWATWLLHLGPAWDADYEAAIGPLPETERPTAAFLLGRVREAVAEHRGRRDPGALATTLADLNLMLARFRETGSLLPNEGLAPFVYAGPGGADRLCQVVLPPGRPKDAVLRPVVLAGQAAAEGPRMAERLVRLLAGRADQAAGQSSRAWWPMFVVAPVQAASTAELDCVLGWARGRFGHGSALLVARGAAVGPALEVAARPDARLDGLMLVVDGGIDRQAALAVPSSPPAGLPVAWIEFPQETAVAGGGRELGTALRAAGWNLQPERVAGGASFTQVADRSCLWADGLAQAGAGR